MKKKQSILKKYMIINTIIVFNFGKNNHTNQVYFNHVYNVFLYIHPVLFRYPEIILKNAKVLKINTLHL